MVGDEIRFPWAALPDGSASDADWHGFKSGAFDTLVELVKQADEDYSEEPQKRLERIRELRRQHHLIVIAERIRRSGSDRARRMSGNELRKAAEYILDRSAYLAAKGDPSIRRSKLEENMVTSARVNWHKLMRRAGSPAELRGGWVARKMTRGTTIIMRKASAPGLTPEARRGMLRGYVEERVQHLLQVTRELTSVRGCQIPREDRILIQELEEFLARVRNPKRDEPQSAPQEKSSPWRNHRQSVRRKRA